MTVAPSRSRAVLAGVVADLPPVTLEEVLEAAGLQTRVDHKYLVTPEQLSHLLREVDGRFAALQIGTSRVFAYESVYFDTAELDLFRAHRQGRRRRYKVRSRSYVDSGECMFEVKLKGGRGETIKSRMPYASTARAVVDDEAQRFLRERLATVYGLPAPALEPVLTTAYSRSTLVDLDDGSRLTCDVDLQCHDGVGEVRGPDLVVVESKSVAGRAAADLAFARMGVRPVRVSKYCLGIALLHPYLSANRWNRVLRRDFGWSRQRRTA